jgi:hypothetical protein
MAKDISLKNWKKSYNKWTAILGAVKSKIQFSPYSRLRLPTTPIVVLSGCGYCHNSMPEGCRVCRLHKDKVCNTHRGFANNNLPFWQFVRVMEEISALDVESVEEAQWFEAEVLAGIVLEAIIDDGKRLHQQLIS